MANKIYKPKTCKDCPCFHETKKYNYCGVGVLENLRSEKENSKSEYEMWCKCIIDWDKEDKNGKKSNSKKTGS